MLGAVTLAIYRALLAAGVDRAYATELVTDAAWAVYERWGVLPRSVARLHTRDPQKQMDTMLRMFLRYPFSRPGYEYEFLPGSRMSGLNVYRCPVYEYFQSQGEDDFFRNPWCTLDFALARAMTRGGRYERPQTLSAGDPVCEMKWSGRAQRASAKA